MTKPKVIVLCSSNPNQDIDGVNTEIDSIYDILKPAKEKGLLSFDEIHRGSLKRITGRLASFKDQPVNLFHFAGHSNKENIVLEGIKNEEEVDIKVFAELLAAQSNIEIVFLNSCHSHFLGEQILKKSKKIKAVIETTSAIKDSKAVDFATNFYNALLSSDSKSIIQAFQHALSSMKIEVQSKEYALDADRSLMIFSGNESSADGEESEQYKLSFKDQDESFLEEWRLVSLKNLVLSSSQKESQEFRIFCIYSASQIENYQLFKQILIGKKINDKEILVNGIWDIDKGNQYLDPENLKQECEAANVFLFFNNGSELKAQWREIEYLKDYCINAACKKFFINITEDNTEAKGFLESEYGLKADCEFPSALKKVIPSLEKGASYGMSKEIIFKTIINEDLITELNSFPTLLKTELEQINFDLQRKGYINIHGPGSEKFKYNLIFLEGGPRCAISLLAKRLKLVPNPKISSSFSDPIYFSSESEVLEINDVNDLWTKISTTLFGKEYEKKKVWQRMYFKLEEEDILLVFKNIGTNDSDDFQKNTKILQAFWKDILEFSDPANNSVPENRLFIFALNENYSKEFNFQQQKFAQPDQKYKVAIMDPIQPLSYTDLNAWHIDRLQKIKEQSFQELVGTHGERITPDDVENAIHNICEILKHPHIAVKILDLI